MKRLIAFLLIVCMLVCVCAVAVSAADETAAPEETVAETAAPDESAPASEQAETAAPDESAPASEQADAAAAEEAAPAAEESEGPGALRIILLVMQILACIVLTVIIMLQSGKEGGLGALTGNSGNYFGKNKAATLDGKLSRITKWIAAGYILLTLIVSLLYTAV